MYYIFKSYKLPSKIWEFVYKISKEELSDILYTVVQTGWHFHIQENLPNLDYWTFIAKLCVYACLSKTKIRNQHAHDWVDYLSANQ